MNITIVGAGNVGTQLAVHCAEKGHSVTIYTSKPHLIAKELYIIDDDDKVFKTGKISNATSDTKEAFAGADMLFITMPACCVKNIASKILPFVKKGMKIGLVPGTGGGECAFRQHIEQGAVVFGLQRVPSVARLLEYGKKVRATGYRKELHVGALPGQYVQECSDLVSGLFDMPCRVLPNYLNLTLTPSNPILHTTRLRILFKDYDEKIGYNRIPLFYEEWDNESSELLLKCDDEVQQICKALKEFDLEYVKSLRVHYESENAQQLTNKLSGIKGFQGIKVPMIQVEDRFVPDLESRYFTADFPYGLAILVQIAEFAGVSVINMTETLEWYYALRKDNTGFRYQDYGIRDIVAFKQFYMQ